MLHYALLVMLANLWYEIDFNLQLAASSMADVAEYINEMKRLQENAYKVQMILNNIVGLDEALDIYDTGKFILEVSRWSFAFPEFKKIFWLYAFGSILLSVYLLSSSKQKYSGFIISPMKQGSGLRTASAMFEVCFLRKSHWSLLSSVLRCCWVFGQAQLGSAPKI